jgi:hypothetical protein
MRDSSVWLPEGSAFSALDMLIAELDSPDAMRASATEMELLLIHVDRSPSPRRICKGHSRYYGAYNKLTQYIPMDRALP